MQTVHVRAKYKLKIFRPASHVATHSTSDLLCSDCCWSVVVGAGQC